MLGEMVKRVIVDGVAVMLEHGVEVILWVMLLQLKH